GGGGGRMGCVARFGPWGGWLDAILARQMVGKTRRRSWPFGKETRGAPNPCEGGYSGGILPSASGVFRRALSSPVSRRSRRSRSAEEGGDVVLVLAHDDVALELETRGELPALLGPVQRQD